MHRLKGCNGEELLSGQAVSVLEKRLTELAESVSESTLNGLITDEVLPENPLAKYFPELITNEQREKAVERIAGKLDTGGLYLPKPLADILTLRLKNVTDGFIEMLDRMTAHRDDICEALTGGRIFTCIENIALSAGDTHNCGRSVTIIDTDAGKLVYKPRDMRLETYIYDLVERYFPDVVGIPCCITFEYQFGVSGYIAKQRSDGEENAKLFWRNMGGAAAVMKLLGSTDMHPENITCKDNKPYILDLETIISPVMTICSIMRGRAGSTRSR